MINMIWAQAGMAVLKDITNIVPRMTCIHDSSLFDDRFAMDFINYGDKIIYCAMYLYVGYINEATNFAESQGGGGSDTKDWGREKDENCANSDPQENSLPCQWLSAKPKAGSSASLFD